jgi:hypothetical protein
VAASDASAALGLLSRYVVVSAAVTIAPTSAGKQSGFGRGARREVCRLDPTATVPRTNRG